MLTEPPPTAPPPAPPPDQHESDDRSGHAHRQVIGYLGAALPLLLIIFVRFRPNAAADQWSGDSISAYYWTGAVSLFVGLLAALSLFLLTYRGYNNEDGIYDRAAAIIAGIAAAVIAIFPTSPPNGIRSLPWWHESISMTHRVAAIILFSMFAIFSLWLFRKTKPGEEPSEDKKRRNWIYLLCGIGIVASMVWTLLAGNANQSIFLPESLALGFFAFSWLVKGRALHTIKATIGAATDKLAK
ncbi:MAG TPA: DUF998 domain-containing protein [Gemmatimonadaceae bacterium]|nr:DUF998 domain-containing protein [Gemmatimonadaceae bacterium]